MIAWSVSTVEISTPGILRLSRPVVMPSARTNSAGHRLSRAEEFAPLIHRWLQAAAAVIAAGIVMPG